ncbi:MAG: tripartite tricarboxylate transporter substrate binding protein [Hyphomicrobiales bacterium]|nr:tripartite tricarboxylate transporter substrate binding protein [Hyphomicrobiales bacterium]
MHGLTRIRFYSIVCVSAKRALVMRNESLLGFLRSSLALLLLTATAASAAAQDWPQRPVKLVVTLGPGSGVDFGTRLLADRLSKRWGHPVVVENRPGGDAVVAVNAVLGANDDHVLLASPTSALTAHPYVLDKMPYKPSDLLPIARGWNTIIVIAVPTPIEVKTMQDLVAMTRANPGKLNWAGTTGAIDFLFAGFLKKNKLDMARVPYRNPQDAANDVATQRIQVTEASLATLRPQLQAGTIKLLATTNSTRAPSNPEIPTVQEAGFPELTLDGLVGLFGPTGMPLALRERIAADVRAEVMQRDFVEKLAATGQVANAGGPAEFDAAMQDQRDRLAIAAKDLGLKAAEAQ